jgi:hypothetical protein
MQLFYGTLHRSDHLWSFRRCRDVIITHGIDGCGMTFVLLIGIVATSASCHHFDIFFHMAAIKLLLQCVHCLCLIGRQSTLIPCEHNLFLGFDSELLSLNAHKVDIFVCLH